MTRIELLVSCILVEVSIIQKFANYADNQLTFKYHIEEYIDGCVVNLSDRMNWCLL